APRGGSGPISTPSLMISQADGNTIKAQLGGVVNARLLRAAAVDTDGTIDNQIVAHEWGHFISNRLVGNAFGLNTKMAGGLGEGWADFHALLMTIRLEDTAVASNATFNGAYPVAGYVIAGGGNNAYYFGIRRAPYSTSFAINPLTFRHIADGVPLPATAPLAFGQAGTNNSEVHNTGEIWANMLWECYAALLRDTQGPTPRLTFGQAQQRMKDYLVAGYKLTPNSPTLLDARNAILAGILASDPVDFDECWAGFARRGAGVGAVAPDPFSSTNQGVIESFLTGGALETRQISLTDDVATQCLPDGELDNNETGTLTITLANSGSTSLSSTTGTVTSTNPAVSFPAGNALAFPASGPFQTITTAIPVTLGGALSAEEAVFDIQFDDPGLAQTGPLTASLSVRVNSDDVPNQSAADDVESNIPAWAIANDPALDTSLPWGRIAISGVDHRWLGPDTGAASDQYLVSPPLQVALTGTFGFTFRHRHDFEASGGSFFDGGVIEISTDGGASWTDIGGSALPGYGAVPIATGGNNPIEGRQAYVATNPSFPALDTVTVSLGTAFQGQTVLVRFRIGTDVFVGAAGWEIDDIAFNNITNTPFSIVVAHDPTCDADADGFFDATDCAPSDPMLWSAPAAVADLDLAGGSSTTFNWSVPVDAGGAAAPTYDLLRSVGATGFSGATCVEIAGIDTTAADPTIPGTIFYYMVGAANTCGRTFAPDSAGSPRTVTICGP
ncbi:MAG: M36 family metallopeptidase, partial [Acidobacteriota bacterium]